MTNYVYKVVYVAQRHPIMYVSVAGYFRPDMKFGSDVVLEYKLNEVTKPKIDGSALYAFDTKINALSFISRSIGFEREKAIILKCEYAKSDAPSITDGQIYPDNIRALWAAVKSLPTINRRSYQHTDFSYVDNNGNVIRVITRVAPGGTIMCKWVRPIKIA